MNKRSIILINKPLEISGRNVDWNQALCRNHTEPDRWHVDDMIKPSMKLVTDAAIEQCNKPCPIKDQCLEYALTNNIREGVWGGKTSRQRKKILREREAAA